MGKHTIAPCLWFDSQAEEAARFYVGIFEGSEIGAISHFGKEGFETHHRPEGSVMAVSFKLRGQDYTAMNGGPLFHFTEAISLQVFCDTQKEIDHYWNALTADGGQESQCGWLKDRFGLSWQVTPNILISMLMDKDRAKAGRVMNAFMTMKKFDIAALERAFAGG